MSFRKENAVDEKAFAALLKSAVDAVKIEEDPLELGKLKKLFKQNVPFSLRSYVAAYLAKQALGSSRGGWPRRFQERPFSFHKNGRSGFPPRFENSSGAFPPPRRAFIADDQAVTIFVGVGRNRHVFVKDIVGLCSQVAGLERERIGTIRVFDNYSFVQVFAEDADKVIESLNGYDYRGRKLSVSFSRRKEDEEGDARPAYDYDAGEDMPEASASGNESRSGNENEGSGELLI